MLKILQYARQDYIIEKQKQKRSGLGKSSNLKILDPRNSKWAMLLSKTGVQSARRLRP
jgi:hypothetical protein